LSITWRAAAAGLEAATALCAVLNVAYFLGRMTSPRPLALSRRAAAFVLALVSAGTLAQSMFVLLWLSISGDEAIFSSPGWMAVRVVTFSGTACVSALVLRAVGNAR
jgi:hypothetical protein